MRRSSNQNPHKNGLSAKRVILIAILLPVTVFVTWFLFRFFTINTELQLSTNYEFPVSESVAGINVNARDFAVAIDGKIVAGNNYKSGVATILPTASTAKMILGLMVIEQKPFELGETGETITISDEMYQRYVWYYNNGGSNTKVELNEEISEYDALASVFLASSNNMADSLAIWAFGSLDSYREYATAKLKEWGLTNTTIGEDASGFSDSTTSTADELALTASRLMDNSVLAEIVSTKSREVPVAGLIENTNGILGQLGIIGVKTGFIGDASGYCLITAYRQNGHVVTVSLMGASTREESFEESLKIVSAVQEASKDTRLLSHGQTVGHYDSWWTGRVDIKAAEDFDEMLWNEAEREANLEMDGKEGQLILRINGSEYNVKVEADEYEAKPSLLDKIRHIFGWKKSANDSQLAGDTNEESTPQGVSQDEADVLQNEEVALQNEDATMRSEDVEPNQETGISDGSDYAPVTNVASNNCTIEFGNLMLINPNFTVETDFIDNRKAELVSISELYGIVEGNSYNGDNLLDREAAEHLNDMVKAYEAEYPGHTFETMSCYRARGTTCGRMCAATGTSDHHTGLTCDLLDPVYGVSLDTDTYDTHIDWQWLYANSYKYGFIDRFPENWAGGPMSEPANVDENGTTGLFETWHYRYVGIQPATEIATGKYNNGEYDSLEHYLKARGLVSDLKNGLCN